MKKPKAETGFLEQYLRHFTAGLDPPNPPMNWGAIVKSVKAPQFIGGLWGSGIKKRSGIFCVTRTSSLRQRSRDNPKNKVFLRFGEGFVQETRFLKYRE